MLSYKPLLTTTVTDNSIASPTVSLEQSATSTNMASTNKASTNKASTTTASSTSYQAAHAVFSTNELLCDIIGLLPHKKIVIITGVCKTWRKAILENVAIQQALFLAPAAIREITSEVDCLSMRVEDIPREQYRVVAKFHSQSKKPWDCEKPDAIEPIFNTLKSGLSALGVWQDMFITQPPSKTVFINISANGSQPRRSAGTTQWPGEPWQLEFTCETGVKLGELHAFCQSEIRKHTNATSLKVGFFPRGVIASRDFVIGGRWKVRKGEVVGQTPPPLFGFPDDSYGGNFYEVMYERYDMYGGYCPGGDSNEEQWSAHHGDNEDPPYGYVSY
jgi:hypothetical protein